ncbi:MAG: DUF2846 domain-containing protein [Candidatus Accumulibacter sp.]|uniref:DUF2846 domain-containing protein n=1 Tax=Accumulibacter sp. TaxID=2053492 RepID=UPI0025DB0347|nr:DUF2846 domain-containing protein [Accumulibacter sp.]MCP5248498.1 DUF2846 domain-containing protein [Accumulibacter sp.]
MKFSRLCAAVLLPLILAACASGPKLAEMKSTIPTLSADQGRIYFYRSGSMIGAAVQPLIMLNGAVVGESKPGGFFFVDQAPGSQEVSTSTEVEKKLTFTLDAGQTRYVRTVIGIGFFVGRVYPELVDDATGQKELEDASYIGQPLDQSARSGAKSL